LFELAYLIGFLWKPTLPIEVMILVVDRLYVGCPNDKMNRKEKCGFLWAVSKSTGEKPN